MPRSWIEVPDAALLIRLKEDGVISSGGCVAQLATGGLGTARGLRLLVRPP
jgi:hypothetical protein